jgi:addiction module RelE/StbE family toxin
MKRKLVVTSRFKRSLRKFVKGNKRIEKQIEETLLSMTDDIYTPNLITHRLKGNLEGFKACSCGYDCRIIFTIEIDMDTGQEVIVLLNVDSHDDVY